jgi:hypothetical protein
MSTKTLKTIIFDNLHWAEAFFSIVTLVGAGVRLMNQSSDILLFGASGMAMVYFMYSNKRPSTPSAVQGEKFGFSELLLSVIIPKVLWLGTAVNVIGILFMVLQFQGYREMCFIGATSIGGSLITLGGFALGGASISNPTKQALIRIVPIFMASVYLLIV